MSNTEIQSKVNELRELRRMADELTAEIESIQDAIKAHMTAIDADTLTGADYKITWKTVTSSRFDSTAFKKAMPELAERFTKSSTSRRFTVVRGDGNGERQGQAPQLVQDEAGAPGTAQAAFPGNSSERAAGLLGLLGDRRKACKPVSHRKRCVLCVHAGHGRSLGAICAANHGKTWH